MCALWPWRWRYDPKSRSWHTLGSTIVWNIMQFKLTARIYCPDKDLSYVWPWPLRYDLGPRPWHTLGLCTIIVWNIIKFVKGLGHYGPDMMWTDRRTYRRVIPMYPNKLCLRTKDTHKCHLKHEIIDAICSNTVCHKKHWPSFHFGQFIISNLQKTATGVLTITASLSDSGLPTTDTVTL